jgi:hypothetical protein
MGPTLYSSEQKKCRQDVNPAANFNIYDGVNLKCFASNRKSAVAIDNLHRVNDGDDHTGKLS